MWLEKPVFTIDQTRVQLSARRPVRWSRLSVGSPVPLHDHEFTEICLILGGKGVHVTREGRRPLQPLQALVVPPGQVHAFEKPAGLEVINIYFLAEWFLPEVRLERENDGILPVFFASALFARPELQGIRHFDLSKTVLEGIRKELEDIRGQEGKENAGRWVTCCFFKALLFLAGAAGEQAAGGQMPGASPRIWQALAEIDRIVAAGEKLDLAVLARNLGMTRDHLGKCFKNEMGETPKAFHQRRRLQQLCRMLLNEGLTLAETAYSLGFSDEAHLCRFFRAEFGMTPTDYRKKFGSASGMGAV